VLGGSLIEHNDLLSKIIENKTIFSPKMHYYYHDACPFMTALGTMIHLYDYE
jgi:hypothetical protein